LLKGILETVKSFIKEKKKVKKFTTQEILF